MDIFFDVTKQLQSADLTMKFVRSQFDILLLDAKYSCMSRYIDRNALIVHNRDFEIGVLKIMTGERLTAAEAQACSKLLKKSNEENRGPDSDDEEEEEVLSTKKLLEMHRSKCRKLSHLSTPENKAYIDVGSLISPTSNCCERLFSEAKYIMVPHRRGMSPILFESLIFLKKNKDYWNVKSVASAMRMPDNGDAERDDDMFYEDEDSDEEDE